MKNLMNKEWKLAFHPAVALFWVLSAMVMIPNYPYTVILFYSMLGIFFVCLTGRENHDLFFTLCLPVRKRDVVLARYGFVISIELIQLLIAAAFILLRNALGMGANLAGLDAGITLFSAAFIAFGVYHIAFLPAYFAAPDKVGKVFAFSCIPVWLVIIILEASTFAVPFVRDQLDTPDPQFLAQKLIVLAVCLAVYAGLTWLSYQKAARAFEKLDL